LAVDKVINVPLGGYTFFLRSHYFQSVASEPIVPFYSGYGFFFVFSPVAVSAGAGRIFAPKEVRCVLSRFGNCGRKLIIYKKIKKYI
jgi:hypothetical protein